MRMDVYQSCFSDRNTNISLGYAFSADIYSLGMTMYQVANRDLPFTKNERISGLRLGLKIATEAYRGF